ncbi:MAG TPA: hypothetical protein VMA36_16205 [Candidatus Limnocylindria bacterium]|nr:hypothetical protein [Candidatus Limnocylindria bacterium]
MSLAHTLREGCVQLERLYAELIRAYVPENPQYEVRRIVEDLHNKREIVYVMGLLSEGENEAALILALADAMLAQTPESEVSHLVDEAWYYLRTSIDPLWQLDDGTPSAGAALTYLREVLEARRDALALLPPRALPPDDPGRSARRLRALREADARPV